VPERRGHDDVVMALALAVAPIVAAGGDWNPNSKGYGKYRNLARGRR
jgi:hypothetical protein